jgi:hypothetical protein
MLSYTISSRPSVLALYRQLPATLPQLIANSRMSQASVLDILKYLQAVKQAYVSSWDHLEPTFSAGFGINVPRPTPDDTLFIRQQRYVKHRRAYSKQYRIDNAEKRKAYYLANKDKLNAARNKLVAIKRAIARGQLEFPITPPKTQWIK